MGFSIGGFLGKIFGGHNSFKATPSPMMGTPRQKGESALDYQNRVQGDYQKQLQGYQNANIDQNQLNFGGLPDALRQRMGTGQSETNQNALIQALMAQGRGEGPNPAMDQLRMTTDANTRNAAAIGAQRGINPALAARMASQGAANANQTAAGQGALMSAQQQLGAQAAAGNMIGQQIGQQQNYAQMLQQQALAQGQMGLGLMGERRAGAQGFQGLLNQAYANANGINAGVASQNAGNAAQYGAGAMSGLNSAAGALAGHYEGGEVGEDGGFIDAIKRKGYFDGGVADFERYAYNDPMGAFSSQLADSDEKTKKAFGGTGESMAAAGKKGGGALKGFLDSQFGGGLSSMGTGSFDAAGGGGAVALASHGGKIPGKAKLPGDQAANDTVPAMLSPGEVVIPRSALDNEDTAHQFLAQVLARKRVRGYGDVLKAKEGVGRELAAFDPSPMWYGGMCK